MSLGRVFEWRGGNRLGLIEGDIALRARRSGLERPNDSLTIENTLEDF